MRNTFLLLTAILLTPPALADFTYTDLLALIRERKIRSVEELTAALPRSLQSNVTFRLRPHSRVQEGVRAIRFTPNGRLILTHSDDRKQRGGRSVEVMEVLPSGDIRLHDISFPERGEPVITSEHGLGENRHLQTCLACHGDPPRLIWPAYNQWPDTCGADDDGIDEECLVFLKAAKKNPRFKDLKWERDNPAWPYFSGGSVAANQEQRVMRRMPNTRLTSLATYHNSRQAANIVQRSPLYPHLRYNLLRQNRCLQLPRPEALLERLKRLLARDSAIVPPANWSGTSAAYVEEIFTDREISEYSKADLSSVKLFYDKQHRLTFLEFFGIPKGNTGGTEVLTKAGRTGSGFTGQEFGGDTTSLMTVQLMNDLSKTDKKLAKFTRVRALKFSEALTPSPYFNPRKFMAGLDSSFIREYEGRLSKAIDSDKDLCAYLTERAERELDDYERLLDSWPKSTMRPVANVPNEQELREILEIRTALKTDKLRAGEAILRHEKCIACHDPTHGEAVGPMFPFRNPRKFAEANSDKAKYGDSILQRVKEAISGDARLELRMPLNRPAMSKEEQDAVILYLESLVEAGRRSATGGK